MLVIIHSKVGCCSYADSAQTVLVFLGHTFLWPLYHEGDYHLSELIEKVNKLSRNKKCELR